MTPGLNPAAETDEDNHLRDDVVAMFRESFDEDGLDFLKRGVTGLVPMPEESFPWVEENRHDDAIELQDHRGAKPFRLHSQWSKNFRGMMLLWRGGTSLRTMHWQDRQR
jgi:hypothetical protein